MMLSSQKGLVCSINIPRTVRFNRLYTLRGIVDIGRARQQTLLITRPKVVTDQRSYGGQYRSHSYFEGFSWDLLVLLVIE